MTFQRHQRRWFTGMVGKTVFREATSLTPSSVRQTLKQQVTIIDEKSAAANYNFHRDYKINFSEINNGAVS